MFVTLEVSHALMSSSKVAAAALQSPTTRRTKQEPHVRHAAVPHGRDVAVGRLGGGRVREPRVAAVTMLVIKGAAVAEAGAVAVRAGVAGRRARRQEGEVRIRAVSRTDVGERGLLGHRVAARPVMPSGVVGELIAPASAWNPPAS